MPEGEQRFASHARNEQGRSPRFTVSERRYGEKTTRFSATACLGAAGVERPADGFFYIPSPLSPFPERPLPPRPAEAAGASPRPPTGTQRRKYRHDGDEKKRWREGEEATRKSSPPAVPGKSPGGTRPSSVAPPRLPTLSASLSLPHTFVRRTLQSIFRACKDNHSLERERFGNDPSAGSPTETLLRLLLPLDDQV